MTRGTHLTRESVDAVVAQLQAVIDAIQKPGAEVVLLKSNHWVSTPELPPKNGFKRFAVGRSRGFGCKLRYLSGDIEE